MRAVGDVPADGTVLLERAAALDAASALLADVRAERGRLVYLEAPAGLGKTTLAGHIRAPHRRPPAARPPGSAPPQPARGSRAPVTSGR
jgi:hypothetical protein